MEDDSRFATQLAEISFILKMAALMPALDVPLDATPTQACRYLELPSTTRNVALMRDIQSYRQMVWAELSRPVRLQIAFGDTTDPSDLDFYFDR